MSRILILGAAGMLGFALHRLLTDSGWYVRGTVRSPAPPPHPACVDLDYATDVDVCDLRSVEQAINEFGPKTVVNAIGVKRACGEAELLNMFAVNGGFPRRLAPITANRRISLVHFSTDGVFDGTEGGYDERSLPSPPDAYGLSKFLGEATAGRVLTIRTSMVGRGLLSDQGLVDWVLAQRGSRVRAHSKAVFSGLPVDEIARFLRDHVLNTAPQGLFHLAAEPIDKMSLLEQVLSRWNVDDVALEMDEDVRVNRSLKSVRAEEFGGYKAPPWPEMINNMYDFYNSLTVRFAANQWRVPR